MSCFVIGKEEYVKAAGAVAGLMEGNPFRIDVYVYDYQRQRIMTETDIYDCFVELFQMNALNVYEYYSPRHPEDELYTDSNEYYETFEKYKKVGRIAARDPEKRQRMIFNLRDFFASAEYQTAENDAYYFKMEFILNNILVKLMAMLYPHKVECWSEFKE